MKTGVYPCYANQFQIGAGEANAMVNIADCESFSVSIDNGVEEWKPFDQEGWTRRLMTAKGLTISVTAKRNIGDVGNDAVSGCAFKNGHDVEKPFQWTFPDGTIVKLNDAIINVKNPGSGDSTAVAPLEFDVMSNGKPTITPAV